MLNARECDLYKEFVDRYQPHIFPLLGARLGRELGQMAPTAHVVDMGTGPGYLSAELAERTGAVVHAVDINPAMHTIAREVARDRGVEDRIRFDVEDVHHLSYPDGFADAVVSYSCFHHWADPARALREIKRILAPNGVLYIIDTNPLGEDFLSAMRRSVPEPEYFRFIEEAMQESLPQAQVVKLSEEAGLTGFTLTDFDFDEEDLLECAEILERAPQPDGLPDVRVCWSLTAHGARSSGT
jgi:ubiquinone/menaquinone biosynthesis C-methylase UbiE